MYGNDQNNLLFQFEWLHSALLCPSQTKGLEKLVFTASLLDVQHLKGLVWRQAGKFTCVLGQGT